MVKFVPGSDCSPSITSTGGDKSCLFGWNCPVILNLNFVSQLARDFSFSGLSTCWSDTINQPIWSMSSLVPVLLPFLRTNLAVLLRIVCIFVMYMSAAPLPRFFAWWDQLPKFSCSCLEVVFPDVLWPLISFWVHLSSSYPLCPCVVSLLDCLQYWILEFWCIILTV